MKLRLDIIEVNKKIFDALSDVSSETDNDSDFERPN